MQRLSGYRANARFWLKVYLVVGSLALAFGLIVYSNHLVGRMRLNAQATGRLFSRYVADVLFEADPDGSILNELNAVIRDSHLPIIVTVLDGRPVLWHRVPVAPRTREDFNLVFEMDVKHPPNEKMRRLVELCHEFDKINKPIPVHVVGTESATGFVHYGKPELENELRWMPFVLLAVFLAFMGIGLQALRYLKVSEQRSVWVGLAKETAHQLGTPLSSLLGWTHLIRERVDAGDPGRVIVALEEMEVDLERMRKVTDRFSKIGSLPERTAVDLGSVLERTAEYLSRRLPASRSGSTIIVGNTSAPFVWGNEELLEWVFENLLRNAIDSLGTGQGTVDLSAKATPNGKHVEVMVRDTGRGIAPGLRDRIFRPGVTTRKRGWGLGLALVRRIVEQYHEGSIRLVESHVGRGTTFAVRLPVARNN